MQYLFLFIVALAVYLPGNYLSVAEVSEATQEEADYSGIITHISDENNECRVVKENIFDITIYLKYVKPAEDVNYYGQWRPEENLIVLNAAGGINLDTVAHEVYHAVETNMERHQIQDPHYGAYLQGRLTSCISMLIMKDKHSKVW